MTMKGPSWMDDFLEFNSSVEEFYEALHERLSNELGSAQAIEVLNMLSDEDAFELYRTWIATQNRRWRDLQRGIISYG